MHYLLTVYCTPTLLNEILCRHDVVKCMDNLSLLSFQIHTLVVLVIKFCCKVLPASSICF